MLDDDGDGDEFGMFIIFQ